jgi:hypothetical protein
MDNPGRPNILPSNYPSSSNFVGPMRGQEPQRPLRTGDPEIDNIMEYLFMRDLRRYLSANGVQAPLAQRDADFAPSILRDAEQMAYERWRGASSRMPPESTAIINTWER